MPRNDEEPAIKRNFNIGFMLCIIHSRGIVGVMRNKWGRDALGLPAFLAAVMMFFWAALTRDIFMWAWFVLWMVHQVRNKIEATKMFERGERVHSHYDGWPRDASRYVKTENTAKLIVEPLMVGIAGTVVWWLYHINGWSLKGLPYFLLGGIVTLPFVEAVKQTVWQRRVQAVMDARLEQEQVMEEFRERYGRH